MQYVAEADDAGGHQHYIVGQIHQTTTGLTMRVNWTFSPHLSLQVYAQPFIAAGRYSQLKDVDNPHADRFSDRFHILAGNEYRIADDTVYATHNGSYSFTDPDFDLQQLHSTMVLRWEYRPGSTLFAMGYTFETMEVAQASEASSFGKYTLVAKLATGGMAEIFLARLLSDGGFEKLICIKRILPHLAKDPQFVAMFLDEARVVARISHPNVCQVFELGEISGQYYIAMEYLAGVPLSAFRRTDYYPSTARCATPLPASASRRARACTTRIS